MVLVVAEVYGIVEVASRIGEICSPYRVSSSGGKKGRAVLIWVSGVPSSAVEASSVRTVGGVMAWGGDSAVSAGIVPAGNRGMSKPSTVATLGVSSGSLASRCCRWVRVVTFDGLG